MCPKLVLKVVKISANESSNFQDFVVNIPKAHSRFR